MLWNADEPQTRRAIFNLVMLAQITLAARKSRKDVFAERFQSLCLFFRLSELESDILLLQYLLCNSILEGLPFRHREDQLMKTEQMAIWLNRPLFAVRAALANDAILRKYNCLDEDLNFNKDFSGYLHGLNKEPLATNFYRQVKGDTLPWDYHGALAEKHGTILKELIRSRDSRRGMHILLYGAPGTGKTSFAQSLSAELGLTCYAIVQDVKNDNAARTCSTPDFRFGALRICDSQIDPDQSLMVVDEADEMLRGSLGGAGALAFLLGKGATGGDKGLLNSVLDEIRTPCVWISNTPARMLDPSSRRRFDYSIRFDKLTSVQRRAIWKNNVEKFKLRRLFSSELQGKLADKYEVSAGGITLVLQNLANLKPKAGECEKLVQKLMAPHCELMEIETDNSKLLPATDYTLEGLNIRGEIPLTRMVDAVRKYQEDTKADVPTGIDRPRMNLLLSGAPGTGKTEFVKYLSFALKTKVVIKMGGDLLSMYVGGTEQNIKQAFEKAETEKAILFLDEIDGLLQDRGQAQRSWEVTQVNELLQRMENFDGILIGATNFTANLDPAVVRRFTFKLEFNFLDEAGKRLFFERMFKAKLTPEDARRLAAIPDLAPGDFRTARQGLYYLGKDGTNAERLAALERESQAKGLNRYSTRKIGF